MYNNYAEAAEAFQRGEISQSRLEELAAWFADQWYIETASQDN